MTFFTNLFTDIDAQIVLFINANIALAIAYANPFILTAAIILVVGFGLAMAFGQIQTPAKDAIKSLGVIVVVFYLATSVATYNTYLGDFFLNLPDDLIGLTGSDGVGETLDNFGTSITVGINAIFKSSSGIVAGLKAAMFSLVLLIIWLIMSVAALIMLLISKVGLAVLVATGPIFIGLAIHPSTREYFTKWVSYCTNFAFLALLVGGVLALITSVAESYFDDFQQIEGGVNFTEIIPVMLIMGAVIGLFSQLPNVASSLAGGIGLSAGNFAGNVVSKASTKGRALVSDNRVTRGAKRKLDQLTGKRDRQEKRQAESSNRINQVRRNINRQNREN